MKHLRPWIALLTAQLTLAALAQAPRESLGSLELTLEQAIDIALAENPTIHVADQEVQLKQIAHTEAWQSLLPELSAAASLDHTLLAAEMNLGGNKFKMGQDNTNTAALSGTLSLPLFAPAVYQNMKLTKKDIELALEQARESRLDLINQVTKAYYNALLAQDSRDVMEESYAISKENYDVVHAKYSVGTVSEYDDLTAEVQVRSIHSSLISTEASLQIAYLQLLVLMGVTEPVDIHINDNLANYESTQALPEIADDEASLQDNTTMRQFDLNRQLLERTLKMNRTNFMPTLAFSLTGQYQSLYNTNWSLWDYDYSPSASFSFSISIPIFTASNWTTLKKTKLQIAELEENRINTQRQLAMSVESYRLNMASSIAQTASNRRAVEQADKAVTIAARRYEVGKGTILELNQSELSLTEAKLTYNQSIYDYLTNLADLDYALGRETYLK